MNVRVARAAAGAASLALVLVLAPPPAHAEGEPGWAGGAVPVLNYDADAGFGLGAIGTLARHDPDARPYRVALQAQVFVTSERVHGHELRWDVVGVGHRRLRLFGRVGYFATVNRNHCGLGNEVECAPAEAEAAADAAGLAPGSPERVELVRHFHQVRYVNPFAQAGARWRLGRRLSAFGQWRLYDYRPGTLRERGPYPGSLYARAHPDGEAGLASVPQLGVMVDSRDAEGTPARGAWVEVSLRVADAATGSAWRFAGVNVTTRAYQRLAPWLVLATRQVTDVAAGALPLPELGLVNAAETYVAFGGQAMGRGVREHRYVGRIKVLGQLELRADLSRRWGAIAFVDAGWIAVDLADVGGDPARVLGSTGAGVRFVQHQTFILRADVGLSPHEGWAPQLYLQLGHLY